MTDNKARRIAAALVATWTCAAVAQPSDEEELLLAYGDKATISIATGVQTPIARAPAVATVITAEDIAAMGATTLEQALENVPGLHVSYTPLARNPIYSFRGIHTRYNPQALIMVNGNPVTNVFAGDRSQVWGTMPTEFIARIEVIRGPGSALYGADAYAGVINIVTRTKNQISGTEYGIRGGSFASRDAWILHGGNLGPIESALYLGIGRSDGDRRPINSDLQTQIDGLFGTRASLAPGYTNNATKSLDARADLAYGNWRARFGHQERKVGIFTGLADALDPNAIADSKRDYFDLTYRNAAFARDWDFTAVLGHYVVEDLPGDGAFTLFPKGAFGGAFPDGVIGRPGHEERHTYLDLSTFYTGLSNHRFRLGTGLRVEDLNRTTEAKNFRIATIPGVGPVFIPTGVVTDVSGTADIFLQPHKRNLAFVFAQDEWRFGRDWTLTVGVRHDRYSDFGGTTNPRLALVWDAARDVVVKAMHGRAFRAPSFTELYNINNPVAVGNPKLRPETIVTDEIAVSWQATSTLQSNLSLYRYRMRDIIRFAPNADPSTGSTAMNTGGQKGRGLELEVTWDPTRNLRIAGSMSLQRSIDEATGKDAGLAPGMRHFLRADWRFAPLWQAGGAINHVAHRWREPGDARQPIADYTTVDFTLRRERVAGNWELRLGVKNLFNRDVREPSFAPGSIPDDLPMPGRSAYLQVEHRI